MTQIVDLWPFISVDVVRPATLLRGQANLLSKKTKGILIADVTTFVNEETETYALDLIAPSLQRRETILTLQHKTECFYPVLVQAECFDQRPESLARIIHQRSWPRQVEALIGILRLSSSRSLLSVRTAPFPPFEFSLSS